MAFMLMTRGEGRGEDDHDSQGAENKPALLL